MASSLRAASSNVANRTVHVKIFPSARTFAERREVLRVLERFGEVCMFRCLKHHPISPIQNAFISIFASATAAQEIINASPVRYRLTVERNPSLPNDVNPSPAPTSNSKPIEKIFSLSLNISRYTHDQYISHPLTNPLYGPFKPIDHKRSGIAAHLGKSIEGRLWSKGLVDWESDNGRRSGWNEEEGEGAARAQRNDRASSSVPLRLVERDLEVRREGRPRVMEGLVGLIGKEKGEGSV
ncbi:predicted protein [Sclerotinia sclerotiorum 1980 UF-70]|uniref:Uncharacterized protein n=2 Tax=Sclerotinia sclerotiorum (strain ATCC 18683 / 1980 / Ss-1) TaxID=665079 RepID=A7EYM1_SCLS1|nr:predicted protein [Sclerotinia sclerotiorum 1980 UF-70]APA16242.1 hypothetical protein sscle_16g110120 [Sclerotinia sclerotiorum 1980 UF-70]EDN94563.1 predicted protein [Sclerotinia sclerotiorum 1980 UF-70]